MKIVINKCFGGFGLSDVAIEEYCKLKGIDKNDYFEGRDRTDSDLVAVVEKLGIEANHRYCGIMLSELEIVEIPDDVEFTIEEYDGMEWVAECHRVWE